jgi:26S proteasome regulatory subunit N9
MSNYVYVSNESYDILNQYKNKYPQYSEMFDTMITHLNLKLWHQLAENLLSLTEFKDLQESNDLFELYNRLILHIEPAFNPMKLMILIQNIVKNFSNSTNQSHLHQALMFLENIETRMAKERGEEHLFLNLLKGVCYLNLGELYKCEEILLATKADLEKRFEVDQIIYSTLYKLSTLYYERKQNYDEYYNNALQYLAYAKKIDDREKEEILYKMSVSSLIGEKMFNFAELIDKDFFKILLDSDKYSWIYYLILSFNSAKVEQFTSMMERYSNQIKQDVIYI